MRKKMHSSSFISPPPLYCLNTKEFEYNLYIPSIHHWEALAQSFQSDILKDPTLLYNPAKLLTFKISNFLTLLKFYNLKAWW